MQFANNNFFWVFWLLAFAIGLLVLSEINRRRKIAQFIDGNFFNRLFPDFSFSKRIAKIILLSFSLLFLLIAFLRPQWGFELREIKRKGIDLFVLVDTSDSMRAEDIKPNRLERAKRKLKDLMGYLNGDRIGLIPFAGKAFVACPLTTDADAFGLFVDELDTDMIPLPGTNISMAIQKSLESFPADPNRNRAIILITDGEDNTGGIDKAINDAKEKQVRIYVMGIGTSEGAPIPLKEGNGFKMDEHEQIVLSKLNERQLQKIAIDTGGSYVRSVTTDRDIEEIYLKGIKQVLEASEIQSEQKKIPLERFQLPLFLAVLLILIEPFLFETKRRKVFIAGKPDREKPEGRSGDPWIASSLLLQVLAMTVIVMSSFSRNVFAFSFWDREKGNQHYQKEEYPKAQERYESALQDSSDPLSHYNLADTFYKQGQYTEADQHYLEALNSQDTHLREYSLYNLGNSAYRQENLKEAVDYYNKALSLNPQNEKAQKNRAFVVQKIQEKEKQEEQEKQDKENKEDQQQEQQQQQGEDSQQQDQKQKDSASAENKKQNEEDQENAQKLSEEKNSENKEDKLKQEEAEPKEAGEKNKPSSLSKDQLGHWLDSIEDSPQGALKEMMRKEGGPARDVKEDW